MIRNTLFLALFAVIITMSLIPEVSSAREWSDLHEEKESLFGSEKELKYNPDMFFLQRESWEGHYSFMFFWFFKYTDYPKYSSIRALPVYYALDSKIDNRSLSFIPLTLTYWETDGDEKFKINPLFAAGSKKSANGDEDNYSFSLLHNYSYYKTATMELPDKTWWAPIIPLIYRNTNSYGGHMNIAWFLDYSWQREKNGEENLTRLWVIPLLFHEPGDDGYTHAVPPVFIYNRHSSGEYWMSLFPLFIRSKDKVYSYSSSGDKDRYTYEDSFYSLFYNYNDIYKDKWNGERKSSQFWFPVIPLYYSYNEPGVESHKNIIGLIDWHNNAEGKTDRFWFMPLLFHEPGGDGYTHAVPPVFIYNRHSSGEYWMSLFPLFIRTKDKVYSYSSSGDKNKYIYEDSFYSLFYNYNDIYKDKWNGDKKSSQFWFPVIPLYYSYNEPGVESHKNIIGLIDWHNNAEGKTDRFWFMPLLFHEPGGDGYTHAVPPVFIYNRHSSGEYWMSLFPLFIRTKDKVYSYSSAVDKDRYIYEDSFYSLFYNYNDIYKDKWNGEKKSSQFWFPVIPLYYSYNEPGVESHKNIIGLIDWHNNAEGKTDRFWLLPFVFHKPGEGGYRFYFPFYFRPSGWSEQGGVSYSPVYYHRWSPDEDTKWSWLIHYKESNFKTGEYLNTWMPFYYHHNVPSKSVTTWAPLYYHHNSLESGGYFARIAAPFYWNIETEKRDSTLFLPLYFETAKKNGKGNFYINIAGISKSIASGVNPVVDAGLGFNKKGLYIDADVSWLVDMWSLSTRVTIPMKIGQNTAGEEIEADTSTGSVTLSNIKTVNRSTSLYFYGWHLFYGLVAYERADTKRHFRLLPLSWITWDDKSDNKVKVILNYVSYKENDTEYLVFFPFYGYQRTGESFSTGYLLNGFWHEYDHEKEMNEYTLLWPIFNMYNSPEKSGWRILPLVWHKNRIENSISHTSTFTPLYMDMHKSNTADNSTTYRLNISPLHFYRYNEDKNEEMNEKSKLWFSSIPFIFYKRKETTTRNITPSSAETKSVEKNPPSEPEKYSEYTASDTIHWLFPLYYKSETDSADGGKGIAVSDYTLLGLPLLYYHSETEKNMKADGKEKKKGSLFILGYYNEFSDENNSSSILFGLYKSEKYPPGSDYSYSMFYGLFNLSDVKGNYQNYFRPFYYYGNNNGSREKSALLGLYRTSEDPASGNTGTSFIYSLFNTSLLHYSVDSMGKSIPVEERETWFIPIYYYSSINSTDSNTAYSNNESLSLFHYRETLKTQAENSYTFWFPIVPLFYYSDNESAVNGKSISDNLSLSPLHYRHTLKDSSDDSYTVWAPILPLYYYSSDNESIHRNILWLADYEKNKSTGNTRFWLIPFIFSKSGADGYFHVAPFYFSDRDEEAQDNTWIICGFYLHEKPGYTRKNFLYLYDHISDSSQKSEDYSFLFTTLEYQVDPEIKKIKAMWGLLADAEWTSKGYDVEGLLYLAALKGGGENFHSRLLPLWYYESSETSHTLVIPPALTWDSRDSDESRFQLWALGALWLRNYNPVEKSDFQAALLGIPYYKYQTAERGYESRGSLWSLLWEYETEKETGFSKFSLLKFVYKRVEIEGEVQHKVLGITF